MDGGSEGCAQEGRGPRLTRRASDSDALSLRPGREVKRSMADTARALGLSISEYAVLVHEIVGPALLRAGMVRAKQPPRRKGDD